MNTLTKRFAAAAAACVGAASLALVPTAAANADPNTPVPGTNCTVAQVESATQAVAPEAIAAMNQTPNGRAQAEAFITAQPAQRDAQIAALKQQNPLAAAYYAAHKKEIDAKIAEVMATCSQY